MKPFAPFELKTIIHSKRANIFVFEHCRILPNGGRVEYLTKRGSKNSCWNIPIANTSALLLGNGTSITQAAMRELAKAGVLVGFAGGGGLPLFSAIERDTDIIWSSPQSEYRQTEYLQRWVSSWSDDAKRLVAVKQFQRIRSEYIQEHWVRGKNRSELLWIVGNRSRFNLSGAVSTNQTSRDILRERDEHDLA